ncbi:MAG: DinB family protein [Luteitalea sp.]|nr:DinB family protein [Luteitalea sp.]
MTLESLIAEYNNETGTTRRLLERIPPDQLGWRPHPKSFTAGGLASHIVDCVGWVDAIFALDELDLDPSTLRPYQAASLGALLTTFGEKVTRGKNILEGLDESALSASWRLKLLGKVRVERPKAEAFRDFTLSHMIHHRGQLSVYLRLLDVPVPGAYGPTADERG